MTQTPPLTGQDIGQAEAATRAILDRLLAQTGTAFHGWVALNVLAANGAALDQGELAGRLTHGLKIGQPAADAAIAGLAGQGLISRAPSATDSPQITLTPAGTARFQQVREGIRRIPQCLCGGPPAEDLATAHRVLATVTERANAELAG